MNTSLPIDYEELQTFAITQLEKITILEETFKTFALKQKNRILELEEAIKSLTDKLYGRKTEKWSKEEILNGSLFNEAEHTAAEEVKTIEETKNETETKETIEVKAHTKSKPGRKPIPEHFPREEHPLDIDEKEKVCACGHALVRIGEETSEKVEIIPAQIKVIKYIRPKYACHHCEGSGDETRSAVRIAPVEPELIQKSILTTSSIAHTITQKFCDGLPFYRDAIPELDLIWDSFLSDRS